MGTHSSLSGRLELVAAFRIIRDVERMVSCRPFRILASFDDERISLASNDSHLRDQKAVDEPSDAPSGLSYQIIFQFSSRS